MWFDATDENFCAFKKNSFWEEHFQILYIFLYSNGWSQHLFRQWVGAHHNLKTWWPSFWYECNKCNKSWYLDVFRMGPNDFIKDTWHIYVIWLCMSCCCIIVLRWFMKYIYHCSTINQKYQGHVSISDKTSFRYISWSLEAARLVVFTITSLWILTGASVALLPRCMSSFRTIGQF